MTFGERLRQERERCSFTREKLAEMSGVPFGTIHGYEIGRRAPSFANVVRLAAALGLDCTAFSGCEDVMTDQDTGRRPPPTPEEDEAEGRAWAAAFRKAAENAANASGESQKVDARPPTESLKKPRPMGKRK